MRLMGRREGCYELVGCLTRRHTQRDKKNSVGSRVIGVYLYASSLKTSRL